MSNKRWNPLPPISRTPSPPAHTRPRGGALTTLNEAPEDAEWGDEGPSTPVATEAEPPRKKRKTRKRFLSLRKDPEGKWKRRKERAIWKEEEDDDMLDSINVAGGFLMIGEGSGNPRVPSPDRGLGKKKRWGKTSTVGSGGKGKGKGKGRGIEKATASSKAKGRAGSSKREVPSLESRITYPKENVALRPDEAPEVLGLEKEGDRNSPIPGPNDSLEEPLQHPKDDAPMPDPPDEIPSSIPSYDSGTPTPPNDSTPRPTDPAPPEPPPNSKISTPAPPELKRPSVPPTVTWPTAPSPPPPNPHLNHLAKQLTFHISSFPDLRKFWTIYGRDLCPIPPPSNNPPNRTSSTSASPTTATFPSSDSSPAPETAEVGPSYTTLSLIITRKLSTPVTPSRRILINYTFTISNQADLDDCIKRLVSYARPLHDIVLVSSDDDTKGVINAMRSRDRDFWKGRREDSELPDAALMAADALGGAEVSNSRRDGAGRRTNTGKGKGREGSKDGRVLSSEFVEPEDDYSGDEDMDMIDVEEMPDSMSPPPTGVTPPLAVGTLAPGKEERQTVLRISPVPPKSRTSRGKSLPEVDIEKATSTTSTASTRSSARVALANKLSTALIRQPEKDKDQEVKFLQRPTQTQYTGHALSNERNNPSPAPTQTSSSRKSGKRKLEDYFGPPVAKSTPVRSRRGIATTPTPQTSTSRWRSRAVEVSTQTGTATQVEETATATSSNMGEGGGGGGGKTLTGPRSSPGLGTDTPPEATVEGGQKAPDKILGEQIEESSLVVAQGKGPASPETKQTPPPMPPEIFEEQNHGTTSQAEGPDNLEGAVFPEAARVRHEATEGGGVLAEKEWSRGECGEGEDGGRVNKAKEQDAVEVVGAVLEKTGKRNSEEEDIGPLHSGEKENNDGGLAGDRAGGEKGVQEGSLEREIIPEVSVSGIELITTPVVLKEGGRGEGDPLLTTFRAGAGAAGTTAEAGTQNDSLISTPGLPAVPTEVGDLSPTCPMSEMVDVGEGSLVISVPAALSMRSYLDFESPPAKLSVAPDSALAEHEPLPTRTPSPPQSTVHMQTLSPPAQAREERLKAVVSADTAASTNDSVSEGSTGNHQRDARSTDDASKVVDERRMDSSPQSGNGNANQDVDMDHEFVTHTGRLSAPPVPPAEESGSTYTPSEQGSMTNSTTTGIAEKDMQLQPHNEEGDLLLRERSAETVEAAATLSAVAAPPTPGVQSTVTNSSGIGLSNAREDDGQSVDIMHGADLLLWAAGAVDTNFGQHLPPPPHPIPQPQHQSTQQQCEIARAIIAANIPTNANATAPGKRKYKPRRPKDPNAPPKAPKEAAKAKVAKAKTSRSRRRSLVVTLKVPSKPNSVNGDSPTTGSPPNGMAATGNTPPPLSPPNWPIPSLGFTPVNPPTPTTAPLIPRPQPYRKPEVAMPRLIAMKPTKPTTSVEALVAARKQTEQARISRFKSVGNSKNGNSNSFGLVGGSAPIAIQPVPFTPAPTPTAMVEYSGPLVGPPVQPVLPRAGSLQAATTPQNIPRPVYAKPGPRNAGSPGSPEIPNTDMGHPPTSHNTLPPLQDFSIAPMVYLPTDAFAQKYFASFNNSGRNDVLDGASDNPLPGVPMEPPLAMSAGERASTGIRATPMGSPPERVMPPVRSPVLSGDARQTTPLPLAQRATLTPEYIETKKAVPLVSKSNFLYWDPSMAKGGGGADVKVPIGEATNTSISPSTGGSALGLRSGSVVEGRRLYQSPPPLRPLSDTVRSTTAPPLQSRAQPALSLQIPIQPPPQQRPPTLTPVLANGPLKPADMVFNISRYEKVDQNMIVYGREILADSSETFVWDKLVKLLEVGIQFDDFREILIVNFHHMVEDEAALNEGLGWYRGSNEVIVTRVNSIGKPPQLLVERMKRERKALREGGVCGSPL